MKYSAEIYAKAYVEAVEKSERKREAELSKNFLALVEKNGDLGSLGKIMREIEKMTVKKNGGRFVEIELARDDKKLANKIRQTFGSTDRVEVREKPELIAGARVLIDGDKEVDFSFARKLKNLFS
jgi:F0F1-type ATP synthase delta subunit